MNIPLFLLGSKTRIFHLHGYRLFCRLHGQGIITTYIFLNRQATSVGVPYANASPLQIKPFASTLNCHDLFFDVGYTNGGNNLIIYKFPSFYCIGMTENSKYEEEKNLDLKNQIVTKLNFSFNSNFFQNINCDKS